MRALSGLFVILLCSLAFGDSGRDARAVKAVYLLPMGNGLDQYLADRLTREGLYTVVTDPEKADAIFTDRIGQSFEQALKELYQPPPADETEENKFGAPAAKAHGASWKGGRGTVFLVDRASRTVIWSTFAPVSGTQPADVERRARHVADALGKYLKHLAKQSAAPVSS
jgi:hypothetical protein